MTPGEALDQRFGAMERELAFVRKGIDDLMAEKAALEDRVSALEAKGEASTLVADIGGSGPMERWWCKPGEIERLRRIEKAARDFAEKFQDVRADHHRAWAVLRSALDGEGE